LIIVYPDTRCWDQHGQVDPDNYKTRDGIVATALKEMINRLTAEPDDDSEAQCEDYLDEANDSITSIEEYLAGSRPDWIQFDDSDLSSDTPTACLDELRQKKLDVVKSVNFSMFLFDENFTAN